MKAINALAISSLVLLSVPRLVAAAYYYEATTTSGDGSGKGTASTVHAWVDGENAKVEFVDGTAGPVFPSGSYLLSNDGGQTLFVVDPEKKTYSKIDLAQIFQAVGNLANATNGVVDVQFSDFSSEKLGEEPGEAILGHPTTRYRFKTGYSMTIGVLGFKRKSHMETQLDFNCAKNLNDEGFKVWMRPDRFRTGNEGIDKLIGQEYAALHCLPLRNRSVATLTGANGRKSTTTTTVEVTTLRQGTAPAGAFMIPAGYEETSLIPELSQAGAGATQGGAQQDSGQQDSQKPKKRLRLKDLLGR